MTVPLKPIFTAKEATNIEFWRELCPDLTIEGSCAVPPANLADPESLLRLLRSEGYVNEPGILPLTWIDRLRTAVRTLHERGIPPTFGFVYDEFWLIFRSLEPLLTRVLGPDNRVLPAFWAWYVEPSDAAAGWTPHRDRPQAAIAPDNTPDSLSIWLPLTNATPLNGCMHILPAQWDDNFKVRSWPKNLETVMLGAQLQNVRALPAPAGSLLAWNQALYHWGGRASKMGEEPRCSISVEFQRGDRAPLSTPLIHPQDVLPFRSRLGLIGRLMQSYAPFHRFNAPELRCLAAALAWKYGPNRRPVINSRIPLTYERFR